MELSEVRRANRYSKVLVILCWMLLGCTLLSCAKAPTPGSGQGNHIPNVEAAKSRLKSFLGALNSKDYHLAYSMLTVRSQQHFSDELDGLIRKQPNLLDSGAVYNAETAKVMLSEGQHKLVVAFWQKKLSDFQPALMSDTTVKFYSLTDTVVVGKPDIANNEPIWPIMWEDNQWRIGLVESYEPLELRTR